MKIKTPTNSDPRVSSSGRVHNAVLNHSTRPDLQIKMCHSYVHNSSITHVSRLILTT